MNDTNFLTTKFDQLSVKTQTAVEWIEQHHSQDLVEIGRCKCHRAGDKTAYARIHNLPDEIEVGCNAKSHLWKEIVLVEELDRIGPKIKDRTAMKHLRSTLQWWKIHRIASTIEPYADSAAPAALEVTLVNIPSGEVPDDQSGSSQFAITSGSQSKPSTTQANVATLVQLATIAYRVKYLGGGFFEQKIRKAWQDKNPLPLIQAMIPFIDLFPGFSWFTNWLQAHGTDPVFIALLVEVLKQTFANITVETDNVVAEFTSASSVNIPKIGSSPEVTDDKYRAARDAFNKRMFDKNKKGGFGGGEAC